MASAPPRCSSAPGTTDVTVFERGERVGGVWHHNTYPGAACDIPSHLYEFSFAPNPRWSRRYAPQVEIQAYLEEIARRYGVADRIRTGTEVLSARWDEPRDAWVLETSAGTHHANVLLTACGQLSVPTVPPIPGLDELRRPGVPHRAVAPRRGPRRQARGGGRHRLQRDPGRAGDPADGRVQVDVYQRSPGWTFPKMDFPYSERSKRLFERFPVLQRLDRAADLLLPGARRRPV